MELQEAHILIHGISGRTELLKFNNTFDVEYNPPEPSCIKFIRLITDDGWTITKDLDLTLLDYKDELRISWCNDNPKYIVISGKGLDQDGELYEEGTIHDLLRDYQIPMDCTDWTGLSLALMRAQLKLGALGYGE